jgi:hypothetical protein
VRRLIQFFALGFALLMALNALGWALGDRSEVADMERALQATDGREAVSLGGSIGRGVDFQALCLDGSDFYWNGQDLFEAAALATLILEQPKPPRYWFVVAAPSAQSYDNAGTASPRAARRRDVHRLMFRHGHFGMIGGDWRQLIVTALTPALGYDAWGERFHHLMARAGVLPPLPPGPGRGFNGDATLDPATAPADAAEFSAEQARNLARVAYYDLTIPHRSTQALLDLNRRIRAAGGVMILVTPPMPATIRESTRRHSPEQIEGFERMSARLAQDGVVVANHWAVPEFAEAWNLFKDNQHLNDAGARLYSVQLAMALRNKGVLSSGSCRAIDTPPVPDASNHATFR